MGSGNERAYNMCVTLNDATPWCATRTHWNGSYIEGEWGYCMNNCPMQNVIQNIPKTSQTNLAGLDFDYLWVEELYTFFGDTELGHCHTYNPNYKYQAGNKGQFNAHLGIIIKL